MDYCKVSSFFLINFDCVFVVVFKRISSSPKFLASRDGCFYYVLKVVSPMTEKQKIFADEYLIDLNATRAYRVAYPSVKKEESAASAAARMLRNVKVAKYITERMEERQRRTEITQDMVLQELAAIAFARVTDYVSVMGGMAQVKDTDQLSDSQIAAIAGIKETQNGIEVKLGSKEKTLELLGRHLGMWNDKLDVAGDMDMKIVVDYGDGDETS
uniref:Terminase small subunit n=1 Tax=Siphoviridae sp. ctxBC2 TaxID=2826518 RepID=A0A8S5LT77_9CAUD|nr:MAG TPA: Terminase small subunit [Siphoviridae sp. ctxBC2]